MNSNLSRDQFKVTNGNLSPQQFTQRFAPGDYAPTWEGVRESHHFNAPSPGWPRTHAETMPALVESIRERTVCESPSRSTRTATSPRVTTA